MSCDDGGREDSEMVGPHLQPPLGQREDGAGDGAGISSLQPLEAHRAGAQGQPSGLGHGDLVGLENTASHTSHSQGDRVI